MSERGSKSLSKEEMQVTWIFGIFGRLSSALPRRLASAASLLAVIAIVALPQGAAAEAVRGPEPTPGPAGLPDSRVYEQVSPANKHGNEATVEVPAFVSNNGQSIMYGGTGTLAEAPTTNTLFTPVLSEHTAHGWVTRSETPLPLEGTHSVEENDSFATLIEWDVPSEDLSHLLFNDGNRAPYVGPPDEANLKNNLYLEGPDPSSEPEWVAPSLIPGFPGGEGGSKKSVFRNLSVAGGSPDLSTVYFDYESALLPGASRLYEFRDGVLSDAGALPGAETSSGRAAPAAQPLTGRKETYGEVSPAAFDNEVSSDGSRIFFVRADEGGTLELYVHTTTPDGTRSTTLVSRSQLTGHVGEPSANGPVAVSSTEWMAYEPYHPEHSEQENVPSYAFASPDGTHVFFEDTDRLTESAPEDGAIKSYVFDLETGQLTYLPWLTGSIVTVGSDGSTVVFENTATSPFQLERWVAGENGGLVTEIAQLPSVSGNPCGAVLCVGPTYTSADGNVLVFSAESPIAGFNDGGTHCQRELVVYGESVELANCNIPNREVFRYDVQRGELDCLSCPPQGTAPSGDATTSLLTNWFSSLGQTGIAKIISPGRAMSADGSRVFFETRQALAAQDTNGLPNVYEWENGKVYLISSGHSAGASYFMGTSESGDDAFFETAEGIAPGDTDGGYDVYDARIPRPGDNPPPEAVPCKGSVCQGPPSVPNLLGAPASETFSGAGNATPSTAPPPTEHVAKPKPLTRALKLAKALKACRKDRSRHRRATCEKRARGIYGTKSTKTHRGGK